jgi:hypothetical protein
MRLDCQTSKTLLCLKATLLPKGCHNGIRPLDPVLSPGLSLLQTWVSVSRSNLILVNDGHDSTIDIAGNWSRSFLAPLLNNTSFMNRTLVLVTFDENETYTIKNKIWGVLLGDVIPANLRGTTDNTFYTHYSAISTIEANWALYHLGRGDVINPPIASSSGLATSGSGSATGAAGGSTASAATSAAIQQVSRRSNVLYFFVVLGFAVGLVV